MTEPIQSQNQFQVQTISAPHLKPNKKVWSKFGSEKKTPKNVGTKFASDKKTPKNVRTKFGSEAKRPEAKSEAFSSLL